MFNIKSVRATRTFAGPGDYAYDAEATIDIYEKPTDNREEAFVHVTWAMGCTFYTFNDVSVWDFMTCETEENPVEGAIEEYNSLDEAQDSEYFDVFRMLENLLDDMVNGPSKGLTAQAIMEEQETVCEADEETYRFAVIQNLKYEDIPYQASFSIETDNRVSIILTKDGNQLEHYEAIELATKSEWYMLYCKLKKALIELIEHFYEEDDKLGDRYYSILSELENDY